MYSIPKLVEHIGNEGTIVRNAWLFEIKKYQWEYQVTKKRTGHALSTTDVKQVKSLHTTAASYD